VANAAYQKLRGRPRVDDPRIQVELRTALTTAIDELLAAYRVVLVLRDVEGSRGAYPGIATLG